MKTFQQCRDRVHIFMLLFCPLLRVYIDHSLRCKVLCKPREEPCILDLASRIGWRSRSEWQFPLLLLYYPAYPLQSVPWDTAHIPSRPSPGTRVRFEKLKEKSVRHGTFFFRTRKYIKRSACGGATPLYFSLFRSLQPSREKWRSRERISSRVSRPSRSLFATLISLRSMLNFQVRDKSLTHLNVQYTI